MEFESFAPGNVSYALDDVDCTGDERRLVDCYHSSTPNCPNIGQEDAGVRCLDRRKLRK